MIAALEVHDLLTKIHDILVNAVTKWVSNMAYILASLILLPDSIMIIGFPSFPFFTVLKILFLQVRLAFMSASTGPEHKFITNPPLYCPIP